MEFPEPSPLNRPIMDPQAWLAEVFISRQGEAKYRGERQLFIRFGVCPLRCRYCDQPEALVKPARYRVEKTPSLGDFLTYRNPVTPGGLWQVLKRYAADLPGLHSVSLTGGEPLVHAAFIAELTPFLRMAGLRIFLETAGVHAESLARVVGEMDIVSMDLKTPSTTGETWRLDEHREFLAVLRREAGRRSASRPLDAYAKIVVGDTTTAEELRTLGELLREHAPGMPVYLQELWPVHVDDRPPSEAAMRHHAGEMRRHVPDVHLGRQEHKYWGVL